MKTLAQISVRQPLPLQGLQFRELFSWLSSSLRSVSRSTPGTEVVLEAPKAGRQCELASGLCINRWNVAHQRDLPCQDACQMQIAWLNDQQPLLSVFVADGAGSVSQGGEGAMLAVNEAMAYMSQKCRAGNWGLMMSSPQIWY